MTKRLFGLGLVILIVTVPVSGQDELHAFRRYEISANPIAGVELGIEKRICHVRRWWSGYRTEPLTFACVRILARSAAAAAAALYSRV
jgi:hypothetical protein